MSEIILISGGTGVGTSKLSLELARKRNITNIINTDSIREIIRTLIHPGLNPALNKSTYQAGKTQNYDEKEIKVKKSEIIRAYKTQCSAIDVGIQGLLNRAINENTSIILEGVHLMPGKIFEKDLIKKYEGLFSEFLIHIDLEEEHKNRFIQRQIDAPVRNTDKYLNNFTEIRWIHNYLIQRAKRYNHIKLINNSGDINKSLNNMLKTYNY